MVETSIDSTQSDHRVSDFLSILIDVFEKDQEEEAERRGVLEGEEFSASSDACALPFPFDLFVVAVLEACLVGTGN
jgi:hypothetical protein